MIINFLKTDKRASFILLFLRVYLGYTWISTGIGKLMGLSFAASGFLKGAIAQASGEYPIVQGWWADFLQNFALPNAELFSFLVQWGETLVDLDLILGGLTKTAAFFGITMNLSFLLSGIIATNLNMLILTMIILVSGYNAGRIGLDCYVFSKLFHKNPSKTYKLEKTA